MFSICLHDSQQQEYFLESDLTFVICKKLYIRQALLALMLIKVGLEPVVAGARMGLKKEVRACILTTTK